MIHTYSTETLWHFNCGHCKKWWSIGDHQISGVRVHGETLTCPHCGTVGQLEPVKEQQVKRATVCETRKETWTRIE